MILAGEANIFGLTVALAKGMITQTLINCAAKAVLGEAASNLVSGNVLLMEDGQRVYVGEVRIEKLEEEINVYNLEVDELHTYFVGNGVLVHNGCGSYEEQLDSFDDNK